MTSDMRNVPDPVATDALARELRQRDERIAQLEEALRAAEVRAKEAETVFETMADGIMIFDQTGRVVQMNSTARRLFAPHADVWNEAAELSERPLREPVYDEHGRALTRDELPFARILRGEDLTGPNAVDVIYHVRPAGASGAPLPDGALQVSLSGSPVRDAQGRVVAAFCVLRDVTARRRMERRAEEALAALLAMAEVLVQAPATGAEATVGAVGRDTMAMRLAELTRGVLGCERLGIVGVDLETGRQSPVAVVGIPEEQVPQWWAETEQAPFADLPEFHFIDRLKVGEVLVFDMREPPFAELMAQQQNPYNIVNLLLAPLRVGDRLIGTLSYDYGGVAHDFTPQEVELAGAVAKLASLVLEHERLIQERAAAQADALALREANRRMDEFVGIVSHELRTPLTTVVTNIQIAERWLPRIEGRLQAEPAETDETIAQFRRLLERSDRQAARLTRIVSDLLDMSRIQAGRLQLQPRPADLVEIVQEAVDEQRSAHPERSITLTMPEGVSELTVMADPDRIGQVVTNYLTNALKYAPADQPIDVRVEQKGAIARVSVHDQGPGLTKSEQARIWDRFHRVERITVESGSGLGLGLGLYISRTIIERHGGRVGVQSARGKGTTFSFTLALAPQSEAERGVKG